MRTPYEFWQDGDLPADKALIALCAGLENIQDKLEPLKAQEQLIRNQISEIVETMDGAKAEIKGFGSLQISNPSITVSYDKKKIEELVRDLIAEYPEIAARLNECRQESMRAGGLRITRAKEGK